MGQFRVEIQAVGNHGCQRERKDGEAVVGCERPGCVDCMVRELVRRLKRSGVTFDPAYAGGTSPPDVYARITHWPGTESEVKDDLVSGKRSGSF